MEVIQWVRTRIQKYCSNLVSRDNPPKEDTFLFGHIFLKL